MNMEYQNIFEETEIRLLEVTKFRNFVQASSENCYLDSRLSIVRPD